MTSGMVELQEAKRRIAAAYDPELFRKAGHRLIDLVAEQLGKAQACRGPVLPWSDPPANVSRAVAILRQAAESAGAREALADRFAWLVQVMLEHGNNLHDPRYIGHQVAAPVPLAGLFDAVGGITNQGMAIYEMGPWGTAAEWAMVEELGQELGWPKGQFSGLATHGGSLANLTALLTARNVALGDCWQHGIARTSPAPVILAHADAHYSVARAAGVLGLGTNHVIRVGLDSRRRMDPEQLEAKLQATRSKGHPLVAVVACACSTPVGAFDRLEEIADACARHGVWLHVDAAHGGSACLSTRHGHLVAGLRRADSVTWDAHKMLFVPALCAFLFYRNAAHRFEAFRQDAPYLFDPTAPGLAEYDSGLRTLECTKRSAALGLWGAWSLFGRQLFADLVDFTFAMGRVLYEKLSTTPGFVPLHEPECNIVVFRYVPEQMRDAPLDVLGQFQFELRRRIVESGQFYIVSTKIDGIGALRVTIINPTTTPDHLDQLLDTVRQIGDRLARNATSDQD